MNHISPDLAQRIAAMPDRHREIVEGVVEQLGLSAEEKAERQEQPEAEQRPTPADLEAITVDTRLAVYIVARLVVEGDLRVDISNVDSRRAKEFLYVVNNVRRSIREAMPEMDMVEMEWLSKADKIETERH